MSGSTTNGQHGSTRHHAHFLLTAVESAKDPDMANDSGASPKSSLAFSSTSP
jgi:hypothetical protein